MKTIINDINSGNLKRAYLLYGEETYLINQYRDRLVKAMNPEKDEMNFTRYEGKTIVVDDIIEKAEEMPFFADFRTILIIESGFFKNANEKMLDYMKNPCESTRFIFVEKEVDKRSKFYKQIKDLGNAVEFEKQTEEMLKKWVLKKITSENKRITTNAMNELLIRTGTDMSNIVSEVEKLLCYTMDREDILEEDIEAIVSTRINNHIFDMISAIGLKQQNRALHLYYELLALKEPPVKILSLLAKQFNYLIQTKELRAKGYNKSGISDKIGKPTFVIDKYMQQASMFNKEDLLQALVDCAKADEDIKTGCMMDKLAVELIIVKYSIKADNK